MYFHFPVFNMVGGTRIDLHEVPIITGVILDHCLGKCLGIPLVFEIMPPHARWNTINWITTQCNINTFFFIHKNPFLETLPILWGGRKRKPVYRPLREGFLAESPENCCPITDHQVEAWVK